MDNLKQKNKIKNKAINLIAKFDKSTKTKISNVCGKVGRYYVPKELFQQRSARCKRALIPWKTVLNNNITLEQLNTFENGIVVEFLNNDFFDKKNEKYKTFNQLKELLGSDDNVSSIISIHSEGGTSSSSVQRKCFSKLLSNTKVRYKDKTIIINKDNYKDYLIKQNRSGETGNDTWSGFLYFSVKGGQQDTIESHKNHSLTLFNPACEYANTNVSTDITLVLLYFAYKSITKEDLKLYRIDEKVFDNIFNDIKSALKESIYNSSSYKGNLLDYCENHISCQAECDKLVDPIQLNTISIKDFNTKNGDSRIDLTHDEAVLNEKYYWDKEQKCILTPARPTNLFWSFHLSNMMQQNFSLKEYFENEERIYSKRQKLIKKT